MSLQEGAWANNRAAFLPFISQHHPDIYQKYFGNGTTGDGILGRRWTHVLLLVTVKANSTEIETSEVVGMVYGVIPGLTAVQGSADGDSVSDSGSSDEGRDDDDDSRTSEQDSDSEDDQSGEDNDGSSDADDNSGQSRFQPDAENFTFVSLSSTSTQTSFSSSATSATSSTGMIPLPNLTHTPTDQALLVSQTSLPDPPLPPYSPYAPKKAHTLTTADSKEIETSEVVGMVYGVNPGLTVSTPRGLLRIREVNQVMTIRVQPEYNVQLGCVAPSVKEYRSKSRIWKTINPGEDNDGSDADE
ncbi:hypothetical protein F5880DRAFT_1730484 [Lentinula raphanica]|nr:hypothetical protein F5880DRAFT_1730484 [Lentinula raphanica]